jgi:hypothetical protein
VSNGGTPNVRGREICACGKEIIESKKEAQGALAAFQQQFKARRGSIYRCSLGHPYFHMTKGTRRRH